MIRKLLFVCVFLILLFSLNIVSGFGVATIYSNNFPLKMKPGETKTTFFLLSNFIEGDSDVIIRPEFLDGGRVANFIDDDLSYEVVSGEEVEVPVIIKIPVDAAQGDQYRISAIFKPLPVELEGTNIQFIINIAKSFPVVVDSSQDFGRDDKKDFIFTAELDDREAIEDLSPPEKSRVGVFVGIISVLAIGILVAIMFIVYLLVKRRDTGRVVINQGFVQSRIQDDRGIYGV